MFKEVYMKTTGLDNRGNIRTWLDESKYTDKRYGLKVEGNFKIATGLYEEDEELINITVPISLDGYVIVDLRNDIKKNAVTTDKITDMLVARGNGLHKLRTGITIYEYKKGNLQSLKKQLVTILATVITNKIGSSLALDGVDKEVLNEVFRLYFIKKLYREFSDNEIVDIFKLSVKEPVLSENQVLGVIKDGFEISDLQSKLKYVGVSVRLARLEEPVLYSLITSITYITINKYVVAGMFVPEYFLSVIYTTMTNPIYKNGYLYNALKTNSKYFELPALLKTLEHTYKSTIG